MPTLDLGMHLLGAAAAFVISLVSATAGLTGAFLLVPFQVSVLGLGAPSVSGTNHFYNVVAAPGGFSEYRRQGRLLWPVALVMVAGTAPGVLAGVALRVRLLPDPSAFRQFAGGVLAVLGLLLLSIAAYLLRLLESGNLWDYLIDPWLALASLGLGPYYLLRRRQHETKH